MAFLGELGQYVKVGGKLVKIPIATPAPRARAVVPTHIPRGRVAPILKARYRR